MIAVVAGVAVLGPGLPGWAASRAVLAGEAPWQDGAVTLPLPALLSATERRRTGPVVRLALSVAEQAAAASGIPPTGLRTVFGSGNGDAATVDAILRALSAPDGAVSPTQFHNSVHNAAAGYWSIGVGSARPATCIGGHDWTFGAALMTAFATCASEAEPVLLCLYDMPMPAPLDAARATTGVFGAAFVLVPEGRGIRLRLEWEAAAARGAATLSPALAALAAANPAARSLRLLEALARGAPDRFDVPLLDGRLAVEATPC